MQTSSSQDKHFGFLMTPRRGGRASAGVGTFSFMDLRAQLRNLDDSLGDFKATDRAPDQLIALFNVLLGEAKKVQGENPVVAAIAEVEPHGLGESINAGGLKALTGQLLTAIPRSAPTVI